MLFRKVRLVFIGELSLSALNCITSNHNPKPINVLNNNIFYMLKILLIFVLSVVLATSLAFASNTGSIKEIIGNQEMQIYVYEVTETIFTELDNTKQVDVSIIIKNIKPNARSFNLFFVRMIDDAGNQYGADPLQLGLLPIRIASDDILKGELRFFIPTHTIPSLLVWKEPDTLEITVELTSTKSPADQPLQSDWILTSNKGKTYTDGRSELTIHEELMSISPKAYVIEISIKNTSNETINYSPFYAFVKDDKGRLYPIDVEKLFSLDNPLRNGELEPGSIVKGMLLFFLRDDVNNVMFIYDEGIGKGSYFSVPEFPLTIFILLSSMFIVVIARLYTKKQIDKIWQY